ncbi:hypothetical protein LU631_03100 [Erwinia tracheiphila]|nr:hypothetical protein [Erwinia tracheiphila]UIA88431.1 hypothetical protein LU631_03100 [Erwinia tracheiphila]UIA96807.1 hypothetical protein LU633_01775 [Erwinia tracheiphila]
MVRRTGFALPGTKETGEPYGSPARPTIEIIKVQGAADNKKDAGASDIA